jgi:hypothetical protein
VVGLGSHDKGRAHMGDMGIGRKPKTQNKKNILKLIK